ncbi:MAG: signal peptidase I [Acholeplasmataceae bacterium]|nr:signal peptidase I [Acholeplasmataceae bacterium]
MSETKPSQTVKVLKIALNTLFYLVIAFLLIFSVANIRVKQEDQIPNVFGFGFLSVQSDSMDGDYDDSFLKGDLLFVRMVDEEASLELNEGDIITFYDNTIRALNSHRIINKGLDTNGDLNYITQGDNPLIQGDDVQIVYPEDVLAVHRSTWTGAGETLDYVRTPSGFAIVVILPVAAILLFEAFMLTKNIIRVNRTKLEAEMTQRAADSQKFLEEEKEKLRKELLEELKKEQNKEN